MNRVATIRVTGDESTSDSVNSKRRHGSSLPTLAQVTPGFAKSAIRLVNELESTLAEAFLNLCRTVDLPPVKVTFGSSHRSFAQLQTPSKCVDRVFLFLHFSFFPLSQTWSQIPQSRSLRLRRSMAISVTMFEVDNSALLPMMKLTFLWKATKMRCTVI